MEDVSCIRGAAYAEQYCDPSCVRCRDIEQHGKTANDKVRDIL